jgi:phage shock protein PspC (stress-responsive transcriptional regulator)
MVLALSSTAATLGLVIIFFVVFPLLVQGLIAFAIAQAIGERAENQEYMARRRTQRRS